ncbi:MAG TPA: hypothetical protein VF881_13095 [Polyangiaceae bacterium]
MLPAVAAPGAGKWVVASIGLALLPLGCPKDESALAPAPETPFQLAIAATSDPGRPVAGARVLFKTKTVGTSDAAGTAKVAISGSEGDTVSLLVQCPDGYTSPEKPIVAGLRRLAPGSPPPKFEVRCTPVLRTTVVGVRAQNGPNLPILYLGRPVGRTDALGAGHVLLQLKPNEQVTLTLSTTEKGAEGLRPQNPTLTFVSKDQDDMVLLEQKFTAAPKKKVVVPVQAAPKPL